MASTLDLVQDGCGSRVFNSGFESLYPDQKWKEIFDELYRHGFVVVPSNKVLVKTLQNEVATLQAKVQELMEILSRLYRIYTNEVHLSPKKLTTFIHKVLHLIHEHDRRKHSHRP